MNGCEHERRPNREVSLEALERSVRHDVKKIKILIWKYVVFAFRLRTGKTCILAKNRLVSGGRDAVWGMRCFLVAGERQDFTQLP